MNLKNSRPRLLVIPQKMHGNNLLDKWLDGSTDDSTDPFGTSHSRAFAYPIRIAKHMHVRCLEKVSLLGVPLVHDAIASEWGL